MYKKMESITQETPTNGVISVTFENRIDDDIYPIISTRAENVTVQEIERYNL